MEPGWSADTLMVGKKMIPEKFYQYWQRKRVLVRHKKETWALTLPAAWALAEPHWADWSAAKGRHRNWFIDRKPGETEWRDDTVEIVHWQQHYKNMAGHQPLKTGRPCPDMRDHTEHPVRVEIDGVEYPSLNEAHRQTGVSPSTITSRARNPRYANYRRLD